MIKEKSKVFGLNQKKIYAKNYIRYEKRLQNS